MANKKAKRYSAEEKQEILDFIKAQGRGGVTKAVKKYKVTAATLSAWKKKAAESSTRGQETGNGLSAKGASKQLKALQELTSLLGEIEETERKLVSLKKRFAAAKKKV